MASPTTPGRCHPAGQKSCLEKEIVRLMPFSAGQASLPWLAMSSEVTEVGKLVLIISVSHVVGKQRTLFGL